MNAPFLSPGAWLGPYQIEAFLGAGGMGEVYRARDSRLSRTVAIKILRGGASADAARRQRFQDEAKAISSVSHANIRALFDVGCAGGVDFLVMEYLDGQTLAAHLRGRALPRERALTIAIEISEALAVAHRAGIIHCDVKPANVMVTAVGAKLLDFGIARLWQGLRVPVPDGKGLMPVQPDATADWVLNGIAYDAQGNRIFVTGKNWPSIFEIRVKPRS